MVLEASRRHITEKFEGRKWVFPSKIYSDSYLLYIGISVRIEDLAEKLRRLGYFESPAEPKSKGEYRIAKADNLIEIFLHDFDFPTEHFKGIPVRISLQGTIVRRIESMATGKEMFSLELEPELVTGLYERIWQERKVVKLSEVPPLLVKSVLAVEDERFYSHHGIDPDRHPARHVGESAQYELSAGWQYAHPAVGEKFFSDRRANDQPQNSRGRHGPDRGAKIFQGHDPRKLSQ